jgi:hypothetical protein
MGQKEEIIILIMIIAMTMETTDRQTIQNIVTLIIVKEIIVVQITEIIVEETGIAKEIVQETGGIVAETIAIVIIGIAKIVMEGSGTEIPWREIEIGIGTGIEIEIVPDAIENGIGIGTVEENVKIVIVTGMMIIVGKVWTLSMTIVVPIIHPWKEFTTNHNRPTTP